MTRKAKPKSEGRYYDAPNQEVVRTVTPTEPDPVEPEPVEPEPQPVESDTEPEV